MKWQARKEAKNRAKNSNKLKTRPTNWKTRKLMSNVKNC